ncbi:MAG: hypothetical protein LH472_02200 [Pyrinomonadaceae bacterium]|nr:hypothetical protein [Pyrinomonadaceae bacterium]
MAELLTELMEQKDKKIIRENFAYLDEVVEAAIVNLLEDEGVKGGDNDFVRELQYIYDVYVGGEKYGRKIV